jgi:hypothetical protein
MARDVATRRDPAEGGELVSERWRLLELMAGRRLSAKERKGAIRQMKLDGYVGEWMLQTHVTGIECDFINHTARLHMDHGCCCDMADCIDYFRKLDPDVELIRTFAGAEDDTIYRRSPDGEWKAFTPVKRRAESAA